MQPQNLEHQSKACHQYPLPPQRRQRVPVRLRDLIALNGDALRRDPLEVHKATLASVLAKAGPGIRLNAHIEHEDKSRAHFRRCAPMHSRT
jgi:hypothetical protein